MIEKVSNRWLLTWSSMGEHAPDGLFEGLANAYGEPHRAYHTFQHLLECFSHLDACGLEPDDRGALELALWFHDAVYDTKASDSEARSAAWAEQALTFLGTERARRIRELILATQHTSEPETPDQALLTDVDLSILGASPERFAEYERQIRFEYGWVPEPAYRLARGRVLKQFLDRPRVFQTRHFHESLGGAARENLERSLADAT